MGERKIVAMSMEGRKAGKKEEFQSKIGFYVEAILCSIAEGIAKAPLNSNLFDFIVREEKKEERKPYLENPIVTIKLVCRQNIYTQWQKVQSGQSS